MFLFFFFVRGEEDRLLVDVPIVWSASCYSCMSCSAPAVLVSATAKEVGASTVRGEGSTSFSETLLTRHSELVGVDEWHVFTSLPGRADCS